MFLLKCWVCNWWWSVSVMDADEIKHQKGPRFLFKIYSENGFHYSEESSWKALQQVKSLVEAFPLILGGPAGKDGIVGQKSWRKELVVLLSLKNICWVTNSLLGIEIIAYLSSRNFLVIKGMFLLHYLKKGSCTFLPVASHGLSSAAFLFHLPSCLKSLANKKHALSKQTLKIW